MPEVEPREVEQAIAALDRVRRSWLRRPGVSAVDVGFPVRNQILQVDRVAVRVHVRRKLPLESLAADDVFNEEGGEPDTLDGVPVDVIEAAYDATAATNATDAAASLARRRERSSPLMGGISVGNPRVSAGTLGAIVWDRTDGRPAILSNWHVLAGSVPGPCGHASTSVTRPEPHYHALAGIEPHYHTLAGPEPHYHSASAGAPHLQAAAIGEPIYQPARFDGGTAEDTVAHLSRLRLDRYMDAAIAHLDGSRAYCSELFGTGQIACRDAGVARLGMEVHKSGRSTGVTEGLVDGLSLSTVITYPHGPHAFDDQIHIVPRDGWPDAVGRVETSEPGDSGALWIDDATGRAIGLHFGGDIVGSTESEHSLANPILEVLEALQVSLVPELRPQERPTGTRAAGLDVHGWLATLVRGRGMPGHPTIELIELLAAGADDGPSRRCRLEILRAVVDRELARDDGDAG